MEKFGGYSENKQESQKFHTQVSTQRVTNTPIMPLFIATACTSAKRGKQCKCPSTDRWISKMCKSTQWTPFNRKKLHSWILQSHRQGACPATVRSWINSLALKARKRNYILSSIPTWVTLKIIMLEKRSQKQTEVF